MLLARAFSLSIATSVTAIPHQSHPAFNMSSSSGKHSRAGRLLQSWS